MCDARNGVGNVIVYCNNGKRSESPCLSSRENPVEPFNLWVRHHFCSLQSPATEALHSVSRNQRASKISIMAFLTFPNIPSMQPLQYSQHCFHKRSPRLQLVRRTSIQTASATPPTGSPQQQPNQKPIPPQTHVTANFGIQSMKDAISLEGGDVKAVAKTCAIGVVEAFTQCYNTNDVTDVFVVCGSGVNGLIGLEAAVLLTMQGYKPAVYAVGGSKYVDIEAVCAKHKIDLYEFVPSTLEFYFQVVIDALLGNGYDGEDIRPEFWCVYDMLVSTRLAIVSVDVPSGWDLKTGPRAIDVTADTFIKPEVLVSLGAPKECSKVFAGGYHFLAGRHLPQSYFSERKIRVPLFPGDDANCVLISSNPFRYQGYNGEQYGRPGQFNATLHTKNPQREWVDIEDDEELWDELD